VPYTDNPIEKTIPTSIKLPASVKSQIDQSARKAGVTAHAFMVKTLSDATERARLREQFYQDGVDSFEEVQASGLAYDWDEVKIYLKARAKDRSTPRPPLRPWRGA
jgi:predicted transcriptional regulator